MRRFALIRRFSDVSPSHVGLSTSRFFMSAVCLQSRSDAGLRPHTSACRRRVFMRSLSLPPQGCALLWRANMHTVTRGVGFKRMMGGEACDVRLWAVMSPVGFFEALRAFRGASCITPGPGFPCRVPPPFSAAWPPCVRAALCARSWLARCFGVSWALLSSSVHAVSAAVCTTLRGAADSLGGCGSLS